MRCDFVIIVWPYPSFFESSFHVVLCGCFFPWNACEACHCPIPYDSRMRDAVSSKGRGDIALERTKHGNVGHLEEMSGVSRKQQDVDVIVHASTCMWYMRMSNSMTCKNSFHVSGVGTHRVRASTKSCPSNMNNFFPGGECSMRWRMVSGEYCL